MSFDNLKETVTEIRKLAKKHTRDRSKKQFDEELFEGHFFEFIKEKEVEPNVLYDIACCLLAGDNFDIDLAVFIIGTAGIDNKLISNFIEKSISILNPEQISSIMFLINKYSLENLYDLLANHLKLNSFYNSDSLKCRFIYIGILFSKEEGYNAFRKTLEKDLLILYPKQTGSELSTGNILFLFVANKNYKNIKYIFQRYSNRKTKNFLKDQLFIAANRWDQSLTLRLILRKIILTAYLKNFF
ncbi:hypothetical protein JWG45_21280 [Leptospira sp. 201903070]|uniref:HEAT repeat domain-containing protein n=1 Tax=Leptospira ainlahdjerensis TaxID=2810033 RepID=A0ABS2UH20_9LEPT|nr:hypothetical protein [Leptospira ainlahdjerensis]MBM9579685.1 hypothetical protein [Leptospira ainlahdjerensis]